MVSDEQRDALIAAACQVRDRAYAPYSDYPVGSAILTGDGRIFTGVNVENAVYGLTICAERAAVFAAVAAGEREILAVAVCTRNGGSPCGSCRQVLSEFGGNIPVWMVDDQGNIREASLHELLPDVFGRQHLV